MVVVMCDMCKKPVPEATRDKNFFTIRDKYICRPCKKNFDRRLQDALEDSKPYTLQKYVHSMWSNIEKACR
ncbi:MAG: hypothetical protein AB1798_15380 [Spirochaetota bacterium]